MTEAEKLKIRDRAVEDLAIKIYTGRIIDKSFLVNETKEQHKRRVIDEAISALGAAAIFYDERQKRRRTLATIRSQKNEVQE